MAVESKSAVVFSSSVGLPIQYGTRAGWLVVVEAEERVLGIETGELACR